MLSLTDQIFELWVAPSGGLAIITGRTARATSFRRGWRLLAAVRASDLLAAGVDPARLTGPARSARPAQPAKGAAR